MRFLFKAVSYGFKRYNKSWIYSSILMFLFRRVKKMMGKKEVVDLSKSKPGDKFIVEHLDVSHADQIRQFKKDKKAAKKSRRKSKRS